MALCNIDILYGSIYNTYRVGVPSRKMCKGWQNGTFIICRGVRYSMPSRVGDSEGNAYRGILGGEIFVREGNAP